MFASFSLPVLLGIFAIAAAAIWVAGVRLADTTDILSRRFGLGEALGGVILLAIATNLPEIAITASAAASDNLDVAIGNILGGIGIQTLVLVAIDAFGTGGKAPLTRRAASLTPVIEGLLVVAVLVIAIMGTQLPASLIYARVTPEAAAIAIVWIAGVWMIGRAHRGLPWKADDGDAPTRTGYSAAPTKSQHTGTARAAVVFALAALVTLVAGVALERAGDGIADRIGMSGVLFGATVLAAATSLPELSTGLASARAGDYRLAIGDILGGNAFLPVLFLLATLISGHAVLPGAGGTDIYLAALAILLTAVYLAGLVFRPRRRLFGMGVDSLAVLVLYALGTLGLVAITTHGGAG